MPSDNPAAIKKISAFAKVIFRVVRHSRKKTRTGCHRAIPERAPIDHRRIDFNLACGIGITAVPNAPNPRIALDHFNPLNDRVERGTTAFQNIPCGLIGSEAKPPGGNDYWGHCGLSVGFYLSLISRPHLPHWTGTGAVSPPVSVDALIALRVPSRSKHAYWLSRITQDATCMAWDSVR